MDVLATLSAALAGRYEFERELGHGGMATVWLASDLRHGRQVAVKVLHPELAAVLGAERFVAEIRTTAALQHPHILPLFESGEANGQLFYVMPLVEGETLRARLDRERQLSIEDALRITREVASALDYAHRHGVIHRDVKPENILLHDGQALVADFGIALAVRNAGGERMTQSGLSLGTPQYMAPEQAAGERMIDARTDVYALGVVCYEMLAGEPPFTAASSQGVIAKLMTEAPRRLITLRRSVPRNIDDAVNRALEKLPADRWPSAAAFASALEPAAVTRTPDGQPGIGAQASVAREPDTSAPRLSSSPIRRALFWMAGAAALIASAWMGRSSVAPAADPVVRFAVTLPPSLRLAGPRIGVPRRGIAISPDGRVLAFAASAGGITQTKLYVRTLDVSEFSPLVGTEDAEQPFFSPDGAWIGFLQDGKLRKIAVGGGPVSTIVEIGTNMVGASWGPGDVIVFGRQFGPLMRTTAAGGQPEVLIVPDMTTGSLYAPAILPDGETVLATLSVPQAGVRVVAFSLRSLKLTSVVQDGTMGQYVRGRRGGDRLVYVRLDGTVLSAPFELARTRLTGTSVPIAEGAQVYAGAAMANVAVALDGTFVLQRGIGVRYEMVIWEAGGKITMLAAGVHTYRAPRFSPDGRHIAVVVQNGANTVRSDIWTFDVEHATLARATFDGGSSYPEYTPDGKWIIYASLFKTNDRDLLRVPVGGGPPEILLSAPGQQHEGALTPDGKTLVYREIGIRTGRDIWAMPLGEPGKRRPLAVTPFDERSPALSPDGRWLAYSSDASGRFEVDVRPVADSPERVQASPSGGGEPRWDPSGKALYYWNADTLFSVAFAATPTLRLGARRTILIGDFVHDIRASFDVSPDGKRFVLLRELPPERPDEVMVVLHALDGRRAPSTHP